MVEGHSEKKSINGNSFVNRERLSTKVTWFSLKVLERPNTNDFPSSLVQLFEKIPFLLAFSVQSRGLCKKIIYK